MSENNLMAYPDFVQSRVKQFHSFPLDLLHAAIGMMGEAVELANHSSRAHFIEEAGDFEFYWHAGAFLLNYEPAESTPLNDQPAPQLFDRLILEAGEFLDLAKKVWVYQKPQQEVDLLAPFRECRLILELLYERFGVTRADILIMNQLKLLKRYPSGYSDHAARARADKLPGEV